MESENSRNSQLLTQAPTVQARDKVACKNSLPGDAALAANLRRNFEFHVVRGDCASCRLVNTFLDSDPGLVSDTAHEKKTVSSVLRLLPAVDSNAIYRSTECKVCLVTAPRVGLLCNQEAESMPEYRVFSRLCILAMVLLERQS